MRKAWVLVVVLAACGSVGSRAPDGGGAGVGGGGGASSVDGGGSGTGAGGGTGANTGQAGSGGQGGQGNGGAGGSAPPSCAGPCTDFPGTPTFDNGVPASVTGMFTGNPPPDGNGPCIVEPEDGARFPNDGLRPRVRFTGAGGKVVQIRMTAPNQAGTLIAYTTSDSWVLPAAVWSTLRMHQAADRVTVTVWVSGGGASSVRFGTAPVGARGSIVFVSLNPAQSTYDPAMCYATPSLCSRSAELRGFTVGDESTVSVLAINQVLQASRNAQSDQPAPFTCVGCHAATPDPTYVSFTDHYAWRAGVAAVTPDMTGAQYAQLTAAGDAALLQPGWGPFTYTKSGGAMTYWQPGVAIGVASLGLRDPTTFDFTNGPDQNDSPHLAWVNLESLNTRVAQPGDVVGWPYPSYAPGAGTSSGNSLGIVARTGDPYGAATPSWSHDGSTIAYASTNASISGRLNIEAPTPAANPLDPAHNATTQVTNPARAPGLTNLYTVPFAGGLGGAATPVLGASTPEFEEYAPAYAPDDRLLAFARVPAGQVMYANPNSEIALIPPTGGAATRIAANDPPACAGHSPGVNNHWPRWSPVAQQTSEGTFYWLVFSSNRAGLPPEQAVDGHTVQMSQLYIAPVVVSSAGVTTYPAIYLWNQPTDRVNTTPVWDTVAIPSVP